MKLENRVAIITGGARGIGKATAEIFTKEGAKVIVWDMLEAGEETAAKLRSKGFSATFVQISVTDVHAIEAAAKTIFEEHGRIDSK